MSGRTDGMEAAATVWERATTSAGPISSLLVGLEWRAEWRPGYDCRAECVHATSGASSRVGSDHGIHGDELGLAVRGRIRVPYGPEVDDGPHDLAVAANLVVFTPHLRGGVLLDLARTSFRGTKAASVALHASLPVTEAQVRAAEESGQKCEYLGRCWDAGSSYLAAEKLWAPPAGLLEQIRPGGPAAAEALLAAGVWEPLAGYLRAELDALAVQRAALRRRAAVALVDREDDRVLCVWNKRYGGWALPGGMVELGESVEQAVVRELREETGLHALSVWPVDVSEYVGPPDPQRFGSRNYVHVFGVVTDHRGPQVAREVEIGCPVTWLTRNELVAWSPFAESYVRLFARVPPRGAR